MRSAISHDSVSFIVLLCSHGDNAKVGPSLIAIDCLDGCRVQRSANVGRNSTLGSLLI